MILFITCTIILLTACSSAPYVITPEKNRIGTATHTLYLAGHGWHTGLILPAAQVEEVLPLLHRRFENAKYYELGWGDQDFYQAKKITTGIILQAIFWPSDSVMHVVSIPTEPSVYFPNSEIIEIKLKDEELNSLKKFILSSFKHDKHSQMISYKRGIYGDSQFYKAKGDYYLLNTCNKWTAKGLKSAGRKINPTFRVTAESVMSVLRKD
jgi:uncharacterized protein (TIGR02117 family)